MDLSAGGFFCLGGGLQRMGVGNGFFIDSKNRHCYVVLDKMINKIGVKHALRRTTKDENCNPNILVRDIGQGCPIYRTVIQEI